MMKGAMPAKPSDNVLTIIVSQQVFAKQTKLSRDLQYASPTQMD